MVETQEAPSWGEAWVDANRRYWEAWNTVLREAQEAGTASTRGGWAESLEQWFKLMAPPLPPTSRDISDRLTEQASAFQQFAEQLGASLTHFGGSADGLATFWKLPLDTWSRTVSSASVFPGDFLQSHKPEVWTRLTDGLQRNLEGFLSVPGLGYTREAQEAGRELIRLALEYQRALQAYTTIFQTIVPESLTRLQQRLAKRAKPVTTLRALYDLWVDTSEEVYLEIVATEEHSQAYGRTVNALMALKNHGRNMVDEIVGALGLPTRQGLNTLHLRQQELRRELVTLRRELAEASALRNELAELRREVHALRKTPRKKRKEV